MDNQPGNGSAESGLDELQDMAQSMLAAFVDRTAAQGWTTGQVLDALDRSLTRLRQADVEDPDPADDSTDVKSMNSDTLDEPSNDWPAG